MELPISLKWNDRNVPCLSFINYNNNDEWIKQLSCLSFINYHNNDEWIKQLVLTVGKPLSTCQTSDRRYIYTLWERYIRMIYVYVIFMVYSDDIRLRYIYGFYFSSKKLSYITKQYLKYNVRKGMVGRSEDVPWTFECLVGWF